VVGTPIGNLEDISARALRVLRAADLVAAEDTRRAAKLLARYEIKVRTISYREQNRAGAIPKIIERIKAGGSVALVSDAGMPTVSDPGAELVRACTAEGLAVIVVPGPSAVAAALALSGLPAGSYHFLGFLPARAGARRRRLEQISAWTETLVFFEAPHRVVEALADMVDILGDRAACAAREITKLHEEALRGSLSGVGSELAGRGQVRGEFTLVVAGAEPGAGQRPSDEELRKRYRALLAAGTAPAEALKALVRATGLTRRDLYKTLRGEG